jgi:hypothetical protein
LKLRFPGVIFSSRSALKSAIIDNFPILYTIFRHAASGTYLQNIC